MTPEETLAHLMTAPGVYRCDQRQIITDSVPATETVAKVEPPGQVRVCQCDDGRVSVEAHNWMRRSGMKWNRAVTARVLDAAINWALAPLEVEAK